MAVAASSALLCSVKTIPRRLAPKENNSTDRRISSSSALNSQTQSLTKKLGVKNIFPAALASLVGAGFALTLAGAAMAADFPIQLSEPANALSLPTWAVHVSSVVEWVAAMALVWQYGEAEGYESWKGLSWGMVPLLGGALCACTWHFFYNAESLEVLVALQAALTVIGNITMCIAAYRICKSAEEYTNEP